MDDLIKKIEEMMVGSKELPEIRPGDAVRVHLVVKELRFNPKTRKMEERRRTQVYEGVVIAIKGSSPAQRTITVRKISHHGVGVERIIPLMSPAVEKVEVIRRAKVRRAKIYYLRGRVGRHAKLKDLRTW